MAYYKKSFLIFLFVIVFIFISFSTSCLADEVDYSRNITPLGSGFTQSVYNTDEYKTGNYYFYGYVTNSPYGLFCILLEKSYKPKVYYNNSSLVFDKTYSFVRYNANDRTGQIYTNSRTVINTNSISSLRGEGGKPYFATNGIIYTDNSYTTIFYKDPNSTIDEDLNIRFPTASSNLIGIAQGTERTIEVEILNYNAEEMPDSLYINFYKKQGDNYNIYSIPIYIYEQFPTYVTQAPLNNDLFLFVDKSKLYSMGINFQSSDEFYLFLSNDVAPKGYTTWNNDGTGILLGTTFETTDATIYDESGLITIPTLTTEQEQDNQSQSDTQKQIDAINKQTEEQKETKDFLKDGNIDDDNITLPSIETNDITEDGIDNIFTAIYNGLTSGEARDIVLPFPFTNKSITIPANYTEQFLTTSVFSPIYLIIQAFYWYIIARFIIKDIANKFEKIKSGNIENIENNNIKTDML